MLAKKLTLLSAAALLAGCSQALTTSAVTTPTLQKGMTRDDVIAAMGQPAASSSAPGNINCMTYVTPHPSIAFLTTVQLVVLTDGRVTRAITSPPFDASKSNAVAQAGPGYSCKA